MLWRRAGGYAAKTPTKPLDRSWQTCEFDGMAKFRSSYVCQNCGAITQRWQGKCASCGEWNTNIEEAAALGVGGCGAATRRRAGHRQVDPVDPGLRGGRAVGGPCRLRVGRGIDRTGAPPRGTAWAWRGACPARGANAHRGYRGDARIGRRAEIRGH